MDILHSQHTLDDMMVEYLRSLVGRNTQHGCLMFDTGCLDHKEMVCKGQSEVVLLAQLVGNLRKDLL